MADSDSEPDYTVEAVLAKRMVNGKPEYRVKWQGYDESECTWEPLANCAGCEGLIGAFEAQADSKKRKAPPKKTSSNAAKKAAPSKKKSGAAKSARRAAAKPVADAASATVAVDLTADTVDLTADSPPAQRPKKKKKKQTVKAAPVKVPAAAAAPAATAPAAAAAASAPVVQARVDGVTPPTAEDNTDLDEVYYGTLTTKIVGIRYYSGIVSDRENTRLKRQPDNSYDRNAIQVLNVTDEQVGHIPREVAGQLAQQMDRLGAELRAEGYIPRGSGNVYTIPMQLALYVLDAACFVYTSTCRRLIDLSLIAGTVR